MSNLAWSYVRFSSKAQEQGDSLRRQLHLARDYAAKHNLILDERSYEDLGISALEGVNATEGALGAFLQAVDDGKIPKNCMLLVESLDRLSRQEVDDALELFLGITRRGITIVTLQDEQVYSRARIKADRGVSLIISITVMIRAHEESATKRKRVKASWDTKAASGKPMTAVCPAWLELNDARTAFRLIPKKVQAIKRVFELAAFKGLGTPSIANKMNDEHWETMGKAAFWSPGIVAAILKNRAVLGDLERRDGTLIEGYYKHAIIKPEVWHRVQEHTAGRRGTGGRTGEDVANLFTKLIKCRCGSRMRSSGKDGVHRYLRCLRAYSNQGCNAPAVPYNTLEDEVLQMLLVWGDIDPEGTTVVDPRAMLRAELEDAQRRYANYKKLIDAATDIAAPRMLMQNIVSIEAEVERLENALQNFVMSTPIADVVTETIKLWRQHAALKKKGGAPLAELRARLKAEFARMLTDIVVDDEVETTMFNNKPVQHLTCVLHGPVIDANALGVNQHYFTKDGGWKLKMLLPEWGFGRKRRKPRS